MIYQNEFTNHQKISFWFRFCPELNLVYIAKQTYQAYKFEISLTLQRFDKSLKS